MDAVRKSNGRRKLQGFRRIDKMIRTTMKPEGLSRTDRMVIEAEQVLGRA
jgi:hypothetical protein